MRRLLQLSLLTLMTALLLTACESTPDVSYSYRKGGLVYQSQGGTITGDVLNTTKQTADIMLTFDVIYEGRVLRQAYVSLQSVGAGERRSFEQEVQGGGAAPTGVNLVNVSTR